MQVARDTAQIFENSACDERDDDALSSKLGYGTAYVWI
jgi:hypothetical protein